jgi:hypothetical protein
MVDIKIAPNWHIKSDKYQYLLIHEIDGRKKVEGYYNSIEYCFDAFLSMKIRSSEATSIVELLQYIKTLRIELSEALQPLNLEVKSKGEKGDNGTGT